MWPHPDQSSQLLSGPEFVSVSSRFHIPAALMPSLTKICATLPPITMKTTDYEAISPFCLLSLMVRGFASHVPWVEFTMHLLSASNSSRISCRPSVPLPLDCLRRTAWICSLSHDSFSSMSTFPLPTLLANDSTSPNGPGLGEGSVRSGPTSRSDWTEPQICSL